MQQTLEAYYNYTALSKVQSSADFYLKNTFEQYNIDSHSINNAG